MVSDGPAINAEMFVIARESRRLTMAEVSELTSIDKTTISRIEAGIRAPSEEQVSCIAKALDYPKGFFCQNTQIRGFEPTQLFHRKRRAASAKTLAKIHAQVNIIRWNVTRLLPAVEVPELRIPRIDIEEFKGSPEDIARVIRASWGLPRGPVRNLTRAIEAAGGLVIPFSFGTEYIDAISMWPDDLKLPPLFFVDLSMPGDRLRFSLCHELGHIIMHRSYLEPDMEDQANEFAAEFLIPRGDVVFDDCSVASFAALKQYWRVSMAALIMRAGPTRGIGSVSKQDETNLWKRMSAAGYRKREPREVDVPVEIPTLYPGIVGIYQKDLGYSADDLSELLRLNRNDLDQLYLSHVRDERSPHLRVIG
jgi:Zn-dependent peptidase ImmA (M78 family)/transcriptional regulator with XRE-family HTH domain